MPNRTPQSFLEKCYKDKNGKVTVGQKPNVPILVWAISRLLLLVIQTDSSAHTAVSHIAFGSLFTWAWLELFSGVNYFRRAAGLIVMLVLILP